MENVVSAEKKGTKCLLAEKRAVYLATTFSQKLFFLFIDFLPKMEYEAINCTVGR